MTRTAVIAATAPRFDVWPLAGFVRRLAADRASWEHLVQHRSERWWTPLLNSAALDVWLITWPQDLATELHDHGSSWASFTVVQGTLTEYTATREGAVDSRTLRPGPVAVVPPGDIHDVVNTAAEPAVSIHAYSPSLESMTYYRRTRGGLAVARRKDRATSGSWLEP